MHHDRSRRTDPRRWPSLVARLVRVAAASVLATTLFSACGRAPDVVLYCAVDSSHSEPIVRAFEARTGLKVAFHPDVEANKSVGHRRRIMEEANNPRCDVFWNNEVVQTVMLAEHDLLQPFESPSAADIPAAYKDPGKLWVGFGARARVILANTEKLPEAATRPARTSDLLGPAGGERSAFVRPVTGTTATHAAWWIATRGLPATLELFGAMRAAGVVFPPGNAHVMRLVRAGEIDWGFTDTDDAKVALDEGFPVSVIVPDQGPDDPGVFIIPNTVAMVRGAPHPAAAQELIDFLLSPEVEALLAAGPSAQIPLRASVTRPPSVLDLSQYKVAEVDWAAVGRAYSDHAAELERFFAP